MVLQNIIFVRIVQLLYIAVPQLYLKIPNSCYSEGVKSAFRPSLPLTLTAALAAASPSLAAEQISCARPTAAALSAPPPALLGQALRQDGQPTGLRAAKVQVLYFGAAWCGPCRVQVRAMKAAYDRGDPARLGYQVVFVSKDETAQAAADYAAAEAMPWPYLPPHTGGPAREIARFGARSGVPDMVVVDAQGRVLCRAYTQSGRYLGVSDVFEGMRRSLGATD